MATGTSLKTSLTTTRDSIVSKIAAIRAVLTSKNVTVGTTNTLTALNEDILKLKNLKTVHEMNGLNWGGGYGIPSNFTPSDTCYGIDKWITVGRISTEMYHTDGQGNQYVTYESSGRILYSFDGIEWSSSLTLPVTVERFISVTFGNGVFIAVPSDNCNYILSSNDGITWTKVMTNVTQINYKIIYANNLFVIIGNTGVFLTSTDGITWYQRTATVTATWYSVCYGKGKFIAVAQNTAVSSTDGITWAAISLPVSKDWKDIATDGEGIFIITSPTGALISNDNGVSWTQKDIGGYPITYSNNIFLCLGNNSSDIYGSYNLGSTWVKLKSESITALGFSSLIDIISAGGKFFIHKASKIFYCDILLPVTAEDVAFGCSTDDGYTNETIVGTLMYPQLAEGWELRNAPISYGWMSVCYGNGKFVAISYSPGDITMYSTDGITWTRGGKTPINAPWQSVCYGNGKFVSLALNYNGTMYSTDGITWTRGGDVPITSARYAMCYGNGKFVSITYNYNGTMYSTDGITWTQGGNAPVSTLWRSVCYGNGKFVAVAEGSGVTMYSTDGITWTQGGNAPVNNIWWKSVCYGNGKFVAVAENSNITMYSTDGITWTQGGNAPVSSTWFSACYGNGKFVAVATKSNLTMYSTDGITWTQGGNAPVTVEWYTMCYGNGKFVTVAYNTQYIMTSGKMNPSAPNIVIGSFIGTTAKVSIDCGFRPDKVYIISRGLNADAKRFCRINISDSDKFMLNGVECQNYVIYNNGTESSGTTLVGENTITDIGFSCTFPITSLYTNSIVYDYYAIGSK